MRKAARVAGWAAVSCMACCVALWLARTNARLSPLVDAYRLSERNQTLAAALRDAENSRLPASMQDSPLPATDNGAAQLEPALKPRALLMRAIADDAIWLKGSLIGHACIAEDPGYLEFLAAVRASDVPATDLLLEMLERCPARIARPTLIMALGDLGCEEALPRIGSILVANYQSRERSMFGACCYALSQLRNENTLSILTSAVRDRTSVDAIWQRPAMDALGTFGDDALPVLLEDTLARIDADPNIDLPPHMGIGTLRNVERLEPLISLLRTQADPRVRSMAAYALSMSSRPEARSAVLAIIDQEHEPRVLEAAIRGVEGTADQRELASVMHAMANHREPGVLTAGIRVLQNATDARASEVLSQIAYEHVNPSKSLDADTSVAHAAITALAMRADPQADACLETLWRDGAAQQHGQLLAALAGCDVPLSQRMNSLATTALEGIANLDADGARCAAKILLRDGDANGGLDKCTEALRDERRDDVRRALLGEVAGQSGAARDRILREELTSTADVLTRAFVCDALDSAGDSAADPLLVAANAQTKSEILELLSSLRISRLLVTNPQTRTAQGVIISSFLGRTATRADLPILDELIQKYAGRTGSPISMTLQTVVERVRAREACGG